MGYGLIYALMNLGIVGIGTLSSELRPAVQRVKDGEAIDPNPVLQAVAGVTGSGVQAVNWACVLVTGATLIGFALLMTRKAEAAKLRPDTAGSSSNASSASLGQRLKTYFAGGPFSNPRFIFFIFMLLPVRTLFAHQWLTMPQYILRAYDKGVSDHMEKLVTGSTQQLSSSRSDRDGADPQSDRVYHDGRGFACVGDSHFPLCAGPNLSLLITYLVVFSIGEALWSAASWSMPLNCAAGVFPIHGLAYIPGCSPRARRFLFRVHAGDLLPEGAPPRLRTGVMWGIYAESPCSLPSASFCAELVRKGCT